MNEHFSEQKTSADAFFLTLGLSAAVHHNSDQPDERGIQQGLGELGPFEGVALLGWDMLSYYIN